MKESSANLLRDVRERVRKEELGRMHNWDLRYNLLSDPSVRRQHARAFNILDQQCKLMTWSELCRALPEAESIIRVCILDEELVRHLQARNPGSTELWRGLKEEKRVALVQMVAGYNIFITGSAGVGKSKVVQSARLTLRALFEVTQRDLLVTASTGPAAFNISGRTLHSALLLMAGSDRQALATLRSRCETLDAVMIDEISMIGVRDFYYSHLRISGARMSTSPDTAALPFGGVQMIVVGDFCQLADVSAKPTGIDREKSVEANRLSDIAKFNLVGPEMACFDAYGRVFATPLWWQTFGHVALMTQVERQTDAALIGFLQQIRRGCISQADAATFVRTHTRSIDKVPDTAMFLYATNREASKHNALRMSELRGPDITFCMLQTGRIIDPDTKQREERDGELAKHRREVTLRCGARVRTWCNYDVEHLGITNGTYGVFVGLVPITRISVSKTVFTMSANQPTPFKKEYQEMGDPNTFNVRTHYADCIFRRSDTCRSVELVPGTGFSMDWDPDNPDCIELAMKPGNHSVYQSEGRHPMSTAPSESSIHRYHREEGARAGHNYDYDEPPNNATRHFAAAVQFFHPGTDSNTVYVLSPVITTLTEQRRGVQIPIFSQMQMALSPGFASTVHASQGATLDALAVSLAADIDPALAYVALSRARSASSISLIGDIRLPFVRPDRAVSQFYRLLDRCATTSNL